MLNSANITEGTRLRTTGAVLINYWIEGQKWINKNWIYKNTQFEYLGQITSIRREIDKEPIKLHNYRIIDPGKSDIKANTEIYLTEANNRLLLGSSQKM